MAYFLGFRQDMDTLRDKFESIRNKTRTALKEFMMDDPVAGFAGLPAAGAAKDASGSAAGLPATGSLDASGSAAGAAKDVSGSAASKPPPTRNDIIVGQIVSNILMIIYYIFVILIASLIAHEFIFQPRISRIIAFAGVFLLCALSPFFLIIFGAYFIGIFMKGSIMKYVMKDPKYAEASITSFLPVLYTMLPITTYPGKTTLGKIVRTPFFYPQSVESQGIIEKKQAEYVEGLKASFNDWDATVKSYEQLANYLKEFIGELTAMNAYEPVDAASKPAEQELKP